MTEFKYNKAYKSSIGILGEDLVVEWLLSTGWEILHRRFSCRWGEIDIVAQFEDKGEEGDKGTMGQGDSCQDSFQHLRLPIKHSMKHSILTFVEVKTRSSGNWDAGGRNAITPQKQAKLWRTAGMFLADHSDKADYSCQFDVAIVYCKPRSKNLTGVRVAEEALASLSVDGYELLLQEYISAAFDSPTIDNW
jgi:putative endonuclease